jgi:hypothetical protein
MVWALGSAAGAAVIAIPDFAARVFSFPRTHVPSPVDLIGAIILMAAWLPVVALIWSSRASLHGFGASLAGLLALVGLLAVTISRDMGAVVQ